MYIPLVLWTNEVIIIIIIIYFVDTVISAVSEVFVNGQLDLSTKSAMHSGMDDDIDDGSNCSDDDDVDSKSGKYW